jgi:ribosome-associated toxin RatA of RatAB toxin-antitoxin module
MPCRFTEAAGWSWYIRAGFLPAFPFMHISRSALVMHSALDMYRLVHDVEAYPDFLSWCNGARLLEQTADMQLASLNIAIAGVQQQFTTRNRLVRGELLAISLVEGPFQALSGEWAFKALGDAGSKIQLDLRFEFSSGLLSSAFGKGFAHVADKLVQDFSRRADQVYG